MRRTSGKNTQEKVRGGFQDWTGPRAKLLLREVIWGSILEGRGGGNRTQRRKREVFHFFLYDVSHVCPCHCISAASPAPAPAAGPPPHSRMEADGLAGLSSIPSTLNVFCTPWVFPFLPKDVMGEDMGPRVRLAGSTTQLISSVTLGPFSTSFVDLWNGDDNSTYLDKAYYLQMRKKQAQGILVNSLKSQSQ